MRVRNLNCKDMMKTQIFNVQRYSVHDGPGIRTVIFLKGCPLRCQWCCNPESQNKETELYFEKNKCIGCRVCERYCTEGLTLENRQNHREICVKCSEKTCVDYCPSGAISLIGEEASAKEIFETVKRDQVFYKRSGGGVTVSGGEALLWPAFLSELFGYCRKEKIHTAVETCLCVPWENIEAVMEQTDLFICDYKHWDESIFRKWTGGSLNQITENLKRLQQNEQKILVRVPLIPGFNASEKDISRICEQLAELEITEVSLLPYHKLGKVKYENLGKDYPMGDTPLLTPAELEALNRIPEKVGIKKI